MNNTAAKSPEWDLIIIGGGPAGTSAALETLGKGYKVALLDKAIFPRDKICGDALSPDVIQQLGWINPSLAERFNQFPPKQEIKGLKVFAPNHSLLHLEFKVKNQESGFVVARMDLDAMLMEEVKSHPEITVFEETEVSTLENTGDSIRVTTNKGVLNGRLVIGADGNHSLAAKQLAGRGQIDRKHHCAALRQYYEDVEWPEGKSFIELHFIEDVLPGYLWVFPMSDNKANVGIGMLSADVSDKKVNLKKVLEHQIQVHPELSKRFANANALETVKGFGIPIGSKRYPLSGDRYMLAGDAARLVDPLSGEGIANALRSGRYSARFALLALESDRTDAAFLKAYDKKLYSLVGDELRFSHFLQRSFRHKRILNLTIWFACHSKMYRRMIHLLFEETNFFTEWARPSYYLNLIFSKRNKSGNKRN